MLRRRLAWRDGKGSSLVARCSRGNWMRALSLVICAALLQPAAVPAGWRRSEEEEEALEGPRRAAAPSPATFELTVDVSAHDTTVSVPFERAVSGRDAARARGQN